ncbi:PH domain-containing protein [Streptomyces sp. NPDC002018]|uniref:PH domain-containing protein n=1 Tax=Streptomyces sp. NPDC002018 TaxID=3364629 RepID=UPI0036CAC3AD
MRYSIRIWWTWGLHVLLVQVGVALGGGALVEWRPPFLHVLYWVFGATWVVLTWRVLARRLRVTSSGVRSHGLWRTRHVPWDDVVLFMSDGDPRWESPAAELLDGRLVILDGVRGLCSDEDSPVDKIVSRLNAELDRAS